MSCLTSHGKVGSVVLEYKKSLVLERYFWNTTYEPYSKLMHSNLSSLPTTEYPEFHPSPAHVRNWYTTRHFFSIPFFETI
ncbi:hypothetical protein M0657_002518 [Pyricularia oryzae]|nr:hypothetical protein M9X92_001709 [Pyricularia oryzae]KAI7928694.1 hypothetical protein M0657_002518 [Pyricularia oryzae]